MGLAPALPRLKPLVSWSGGVTVGRMRAMTLAESGSSLVVGELPVPEPGEHDIRLQVLACGVCQVMKWLGGCLEIPLAHVKGRRATRSGAAFGGALHGLFQFVKRGLESLFNLMPCLYRG